MEQVEVGRRVEQMLRNEFGSELLEFGQLVDQRTQDLFLRGALTCQEFWEYIERSCRPHEGSVSVSALDDLDRRMYEAFRDELARLVE